MKTHKKVMYSGITSVLIGLLLSGSHVYYGPIMMATGLILVSFFILKDKGHRVLFSIITVATLLIMFILEYFVLKVQNTQFYQLLFILSLGFIFTFIPSLKSQNSLTHEEKILGWSGTILFSIGFFGIMGIIFNDFSGSLILGVLLLIFIMFTLFLRRRISKEEELENEFEDVYASERNNQSYWFSYEVGGIPKPVSLKGWACYGIILLSPLIMVVFNDPTIDTAFILAIIFGVILISFLKSNYREIVKEYRKDLKNENER